MPDQVAILMVDDDRNISLLTQEFLRARGYAVTLMHNAHDAMRVMVRDHFDLCILDIEMPMKDGFTLATEIRQSHPAIPVIFLTAKTAVEDRVRGLRLGAEDYITKPYSLEELDLRIRNIVKRTPRQVHNEHATYNIGRWTFTPATRQLNKGEENRPLTTIESQLLQMLCIREGGVLKRDDALREIWGDEYRIKESNLKVYISKLRRLFNDEQGIEILNVHGVGYRLVVDYQRSSPTANSE